MIPDSDKYLILDQNEKIGYTFISGEKTLVEFFIIDKHATGSSKYLSRVVDSLSVKSILCKSFDYLLLNCCFRNLYGYTPKGVLYRDFIDSGIGVSNELEVERADESTMEIIRRQKDCFDELFETEFFLRSFISKEYVFLFYKNENLVGCGMVLRTHPEWNYCDLEVWVKSDFRKQGFGAQIITYLRKFALENGFRPTCGCSVDNVASQRTLENAGFISRHSLIEFRC